MQFLDGSFGTAALAIMDLQRRTAHDDLPDVTWNALGTFYGSPVDRIVYSAEALWALAKHGSAPPAAVTLCAQLAYMAVSQHFHELGSTDRGPRMIAACRRMLGEDVASDPADDPIPMPQYTPVD